jgi:ketosteroid isomerase-like protein
MANIGAHLMKTNGAGAVMDGVVRGAIAALILIASFALQTTAQPSDIAQTAIRAALMKWMADFNTGNRQAVCSLFSSDLLHDYRGQPERNFKDVCDLLRRSLSDRTKRYNYSVVIKEILVSGDLAIVRLIWSLKISKIDAPGEIISEEPGMDVFRKEPDGSWKIIRYIAYETAG